MLRTLSHEEIIDRMDELLEARYGSAPLGNVADPLDELIYIILSTQTGPNGYRRTFEALKERFPKWEYVLQAPENEVERIIRPAGLSRLKSRYIRGAVKRVVQEARARSGGASADASLDFLVRESDQEAEAFLASLPGVSVKSARCVLLYAFGRDVFPVDTHILRVFTRMGLVGPIHRKKAHDPIQDLVPPKIRRRLHINLIHHGRAICRPQAPQCSKCSLISFCKTGLDRLRHSPKRAPVAVDLFAGAGGLSLGFRRAGFEIRFAAETSRHAAQTYRFNLPGVPVFETDVRRLRGKDILPIAGLDKGDIDVLLGGPPCQGYSQAGKRHPDHRDNYLYRHLARLGAELSARVIIMENVPGIANVRGKKFITAIKSSFCRHGFTVREFLLNAGAYGVPQRRARILFLAADRRSLLSAKLTPPPPTFSLEPCECAREKMPVTPTVAEALDGLPPRRPGEGKEADVWLGKPLYNHVAMAHSASVIAKIRKIRAGEGPISYRRLCASEPARTIIAGHRALPVHPIEHRTLTAREAARLQSFDDHFRFLGPRSQHPQQIANAVPPPLAEAVARHIKPWLYAR